jgi:hypothetical protein
LLISKIANGKKRTRQVKGRGIIAAISKKVKLISVEACLQDMRYLSKWNGCISHSVYKMNVNKSRVMQSSGRKPASVLIS